MLHRFRPWRWAPLRVACTARRTFSSTVRLGNRLVSGKARPRPARVRTDTGAWLRSTPLRCTEPLLAAICPDTRLKKVVLPAPLGPTMAVSVPGAKLHETAFTATCPPKRTVRSWVCSMWVVPEPAPGPGRGCGSVTGRQVPRGGGTVDDQRLLRIGTFISSGLISRTSSGTPQAKAGSTLILKWYMLCSAWWSSLRKVILPLGVSKLMPSRALISLLVPVSPLVFLSAVTTAIAAFMPPAVKKSGGVPYFFSCALISQSLIGFLGKP